MQALLRSLLLLLVAAGTACAGNRGSPVTGGRDASRADAEPLDASGAADAALDDGSPGAKIALGVFVADDALGGGAPWTPAVIDNYVSLIGGKPALWHWYEGFGTKFTKANFDAVSSRGYFPVLSWAPAKADYTDIGWDRVVAGDVDSLIHAFAQGAKTWGKPFILRLRWEMDLNFNGTSNTPSSFVAMWKHAHDIFTQEGVTNVKWFWCSGETDTTVAPSSYYPGDAYVDYIGFDAYNWGTTQSWSRWRSVTDTYRQAYDAVTKLSSKPLIVGETGSVEQGGDKAAWFTALITEVPKNFPRVVAVIYFNQNPPPTDWRVNTSPASLAAFKDVVASPVYRGTLP